MADSELAPAPVARADAAGRRSRLRQYQVQLLERMQAARTSDGGRVNQLGMEIGAERYLLDLTEAGEIVPYTALGTVPLTQPWYLGLANIRGNLVGVVDLARYLGQGETATGPDARIVTFGAALGFNCALLVSRLYGLRQGGDMTPSGARLRDADANEWTPLALAALVREARFLHVGV
jgi:twitching motility protein PilI